MSALAPEHWIVGGLFIGVASLFAALYLIIRYTERRKIALGLLASGTTLFLPTGVYLLALSFLVEKLARAGRPSMAIGIATLAALIYCWLHTLKREKAEPHAVDAS